MIANVELEKVYESCTVKFNDVELFICIDEGDRITIAISPNGNEEMVVKMNKDGTPFMVASKHKYLTRSIK